ncbi:hypothetical protein GCM10007416_15510 [Kroppenstedtia guangzhouensis]|uniref:Uncharacterized protein n=1 Tax=Kroppenstedtia guangzhouensis TaxID=1274356 RepID=A0ABQ1GGI2_9BACL|nr:hypothetical protein GCM10007416_15510 [Kroppenstedtia guangzhouensis]
MEIYQMINSVKAKRGGTDPKPVDKGEAFGRGAQPEDPCGDL